MTEAKPLPPIDRLRELLDYDPATGVLTWTEARGPQYAGKVAGSVDGGGYREVKVDGRMVKAHRLCYALATGADPYPNEIDHVNRNPEDNHIGNLRMASVAEQNANRVLPHRQPISVVWPDGSRCVARGVAAAAWLTQMGRGAVKQRVRRNRLGLTQGPTRSGVELTRCKPM